MKITAAFFIVLSFLAFTPAGYAAEEDHWLYVVNANGATISPMEDREGEFKLRLENVSPQVLFFSERPNQEVDAVPAQRFFDKWREAEKKFRRKPPFVALDPLIPGEQEDLIYLLEIQNPVYDAAARVLEYEIRFIGDETRKPQRLSHRKVGTNPPRNFQEAALFMDRLPVRP